MSYWLDWLRYRFWGSGVGMIVLLLLILGIAMVFFYQWEEQRKAQEGLPVVATITKLSFSGTRYQPGPMAHIVARDETGATGRESVPPLFAAGCEVGDKIKAKRVDAMLILQPAPCRRWRPNR
jgi:hypothetical protein